MKKFMLSIGVFVAFSSGLFAADDQPYLAENLSVWLRADKGLTTNAVGGVTAWANQGTKGASVDVVPHADNSDGHVAYEASGMTTAPGSRRHARRIARRAAGSSRLARRTMPIVSRSRE